MNSYIISTSVQCGHQPKHEQYGGGIRTPLHWIRVDRSLLNRHYSQHWIGRADNQDQQFTISMTGSKNTRPHTM